MSGPTAEIINNGWRNSYIVAQSRQGAIQPRPKSMVLEKLLASQRGRFYTIDVKSRLASKDPNKNDISVTLVKLKRDNFGANALFDSACTPASTSEQLARSYKLGRYIQNKMSLSLEDFACMLPDNTALADQKMQQFWVGLHEQLSVAVEQYIYSEKFIGKLPALTTGGAPRNFANLPALKADGFTLNPRAELDIMEDMAAANAGSYFTVGGTRMQAYQIAQKIASPALAGYDPSKLDSITGAQAVVSPMVAASAYIQGLGIQNPMLVIEDGALALVSAPLRPLGTIQEGKGQRFWSVEHPNLPGIFVNITETINEVCDVNGRYTITWAGSIIYDVIGEMSCDADGNIWSDGTAMKGVYLYDLVCTDDTLCDAPNRIAALPDFSQAYDKSCTNDIVCAADAGCSLNVVTGYRVDPDSGKLYLILTATFNTSLGASQPTGFNWAVNAVALPETTAIVSVDTALLNDGDVITVSAKDSLDCEKLVTYVVTNLQQNCTTVICAMDDVEYLDGDTVDLGIIAQGSARTIRQNFSVAAGQATVTNATASGDYTDLVINSTLPYVMTPSSALLDIDTDLDTATLGAKSVTTTVTHDGCDGEFVITLTYTVTA